MQSLQHILGKFVREFGIQGSVALRTVTKEWSNIVGHTIAAHTLPDTIRGKTITVIVDTPQWMHHLSFYRGEILNKLEPFDIRDIRFRVGRIPEMTGSAERTAEERELSEDELRYIENTVKNLKDNELKETFRKLIAHGLKKGRT